MLKNFFLFPLHVIRKILTIVKNYKLPVQEKPSLRTRTWDLYYEDEMKNCYKHFRKYFDTSVILNTQDQIREHAILNALKNHKEDDLYLEFGVFSGGSANFFSKILKDKTLYGFDSFKGLKNDWKGHLLPTGHFNLKEKVPKVNNNVELIVGWVEDTLEDFLKENNNRKINFVHIDMDTYEPAKFILKKIKPFLKKNTIILFDEVYNFPGWNVGEYKALQEVFKEKEYTFIGFSRYGHQASIKIL